jgi:hypothetical protein
MQAGVAAVIGALRVVLGADTPIVEPGSGLRQLDIERWGALPLSTSSAWAQFSKVVVSPKE